MQYESFAIGKRFKRLGVWKEFLNDFLSSYSTVAESLYDNTAEINRGGRAVKSFHCSSVEDIKANPSFSCMIGKVQISYHLKFMPPILICLFDCVITTLLHPYLC